MLGPSSFRSQQPVKSSLKTYRSRGKRTAASASSSDTTASDHKPARQFDWDRLAQERKARIEHARVQAQLRREAQLEQEAEDAQLVAALYSDPPSDEALSQESDAVMVVPSTQGSEDELTYPSYTNPTSSSSGRTASVSFSIPAETTTRMKQALQREKTFSEQDYEDDDQDEVDGEDGQDEVLFRSPSFDLLKRLREIPKPQFPEPRTSTFGYGPLSEPGASAPADAGPISASVSPSLPSTAIDAHDPKNPFLILESPKIKKTMDIFQRRRQQLTELQNRRKSTSERPRGSAGLTQDPDLTMEIEAPGNLQQRQQRRDMATSEKDKTEVLLGLEVVRDNVAPTQHPRQTTPEPSTPKNADGNEQDDCVDWALGKRMSSIEITPRRMMAKQRKLAAQDPVSPSRPDRTKAAQRGAGHALDRNRRTEPLLEPPPKLYLDRDPPDNTHDSDEFDFLFNSKSSVFKSRNPLANSLSSSEKNRSKSLEGPNEWQLSSPTLNPKKAPTQSMEQQRRSKMNQDQRTTTSASTARKQEVKEGCEHVFDDRPLPSQLKARSATSYQNPVAVLPLVQRQPSPSRQQSADTNEQGEKRPQPARQVRSLRRPPAVLVSHRNKEIFRPTLEDLLAISDQRFFEQFRDADSSSDPLVSTGDKENRPEQQARATTSGVQQRTEIVDFESLLPECMAKTLTKIGEASYSEVYTVDLPVQQQRQHRLQQSLRKKNSWSSYSRGGTQRAEDEIALFQSPRLNSYVKESAEDDLTPQSTDTRNGATAERTRLVMKIMPFNETGDRSATDSERTRKSRGRTRTESDLLALEDIYREARVSTQIMHGWKGFIGSFGALVVRGKYPKPLLAAWDRFRKANGTESWRPDIYPKNQLYCIILLPYGGTDLEHCPLANWKQAWSVLTQIAASLESKEQAPFWFEHRDLHWGNILVKGTRQEIMVFARRDFDRDDEHQEKGSSTDLRARLEHRTIPTFGIVVQMIDFTLARVQGDKGNLIYMDLEKDQDLFRGQGDYQFEIYRKMRKQIGKDWAASCPRTNLYWLHYIADKLVNEKELDVPSSYPSSSSREKIAVLRRPSMFSSSSGQGMVRCGSDDDEKMEAWCYSRVLAVLKMYPDRLDPCGQTPSGTVLDLLLHDGS